VVEGGWSSRNNVPLSDGTPQQQVEFFTKYEALLDSIEAEAWVLLTFTDLDIGALDLSPDRAAGLSSFAYMGILDANLSSESRRTRSGCASSGGGSQTEVTARRVGHECRSESPRDIRWSRCCAASTASIPRSVTEKT
jgi:hypothetical protein